MRKLFFIWIILLSIAQFSIAQNQKTIVKTFDLINNYSEIEFALEGAIEVQEWDKDYIQIITTVNAPNIGDVTLTSLAIAGRYDYATFDDQERNVHVFTFPMHMHGFVPKINIWELNETITHFVYVPKGKKVRVEHIHTTLML